MLFILNENVTKDNLLKCAERCYFKDDISIIDLY